MDVTLLSTSMVSTHATNTTVTLATLGSVAFGFVLHHGTCICDITLVVVYIYLTLSITIQRTLFPMLPTAPLDRAALVPSKSPFLKDSKSKVS